MDRRRNGLAGESPMTTLTQLPALVALERIPVPVLAVEQDGTVLYGNGAFASMLGYSREDVLSLKFNDIFPSMDVGESAVSVLRAHAGNVVDLTHMEGSVVRARMSNSALLRGDDPVALATFEDLTDQLWIDEP
jgi:PAS domain S-box-containing protein